MSAGQSIYIEAPVEKVFDWFRNPRNWPMLNPDAQREELADVHVTREGVGTFHVWVIKPLPGVRFECFGVFTEFVPNKRIVDKWSLALEGSETRQWPVTLPVLGRSRCVEPHDALPAWVVAKSETQHGD